MAQFHQDVQKLESRQLEQQMLQRDKTLAKLTVRKRMREELQKEGAVNKELDFITKTQAGGIDKLLQIGCKAHSLVNIHLYVASV